MANKKRLGERQFTPESTKAWTLALYPLAILLGTAFLLITNREITTDIIGLFVGLLTAGSLQAAVKRNGGKDVKRDDSNDSDTGIRPISDKKLDDLNRSWSDNLDRWRDSYDFIRLGQIF